jgi:hypothetical protein
MKSSLLAGATLVGAISATNVVAGEQADFSTYRLRDVSLKAVVLCSDNSTRDVEALSRLAEVLLGTGEVTIIDGRDEETKFGPTETVFAYVGDETIGVSGDCMRRRAGFLEFVASHIQRATDGKSPPFYSSMSNELTTQSPKVISAICSPGTARCLAYAYVELLGFDTYICEVSNVCLHDGE